MKFFAKIPGLIKRHYEKVLLVLALLGLVTAVWFLNAMKASENEKIVEYEKGIPKRKVPPLVLTDVSALQSALQHAASPTALNFSPPHNLFNPVKWLRKPDGILLKVETGKEVGPSAAVITGIAPLNLIITLDRPSGAGLYMTVVQEASTNVALRRKYQSYIGTNGTERMDRTKTFTLREVKGTAEAPVAVIELADGTTETISGDMPLTRVAGRKADISYPPEKKNFTGQRIGDVLVMDGEDYIIVAINPNEVVVSARSNGRLFSMRTVAAPN